MKFKNINLRQLIKEKWIYLAAYFYLFISIAMFLLGNVKYSISIPVTILLAIAVWKASLNAPKMTINLLENHKKVIIILGMITAWVILAGIGGFVWQNTWDHKFRNAIFMDLVGKNWPVIQDGKALCYYLGFWLPSAIVGKIAGLQIGYLFQILWAVIGITIAFGMICQYLKKIRITNIIILIFYSGLDIFLFLLFSKLPIKESLLQIIGGRHIELATTYFNSSSNTTLLFWLYNQIIPFWVGMMLLLQQKNSKSIGLIYAMLLLYSPFPLVALAPVMVYLVCKKPKTEEQSNLIRKWMNRIKKACTFENIVSLLLIVIIGLFMKSNTAVGKISILEVNGENILKYICYLFFEFILYLIFIYKQNRKDVILNILIGITFIMPFILLGNSYDFAYRTCIPLAFYIMLLIMKELQNEKANKKISIALIIVLSLGAVTPITEMVRTVKHEAKVLQREFSARSDSLPSVFVKEGNECYDNFIADTNSIFYQYLAK